MLGQRKHGLGLEGVEAEAEEGFEEGFLVGGRATVTSVSSVCSSSTSSSSSTTGVVWWFLPPKDLEFPWEEEEKGDLAGVGL